jgi:predicted glycoside hydrolase/deacetylase ChbG (UPF0249 family)
MPRITVDDLGLFRGVERSVLELAAAGFPLNCSWVTNYHPPSDEYLRRAPAANINSGLHFNVIEGISETNAKTLADARGRFRRAWHEFFFANAQMRREVEGELEFQLAKARAWFGALSHVDSHVHVHAVPWVYRLLVKYQARFGYAHIRRPAQLISDRTTLDPRVLALRVLSLANRATGLPCFGVHQTFRMTAGSCLPAIRRGARELIFHTHAGAEEIVREHYRYFDDEQLALRQREHTELRALLRTLSAPTDDATN